jgi:hypothetical protein
MRFTALAVAHVGRFHVHAVEDVRLDAVGGHALGDAVRGARGGHTGVGHHEDPARPAAGKIETDLVGRAAAELERRGAVCENGLLTGGNGRAYDCPSLLSAM